jgi:hypothetical protein
MHAGLMLGFDAEPFLPSRSQLKVLGALFVLGWLAVYVAFVWIASRQGVRTVQSQQVRVREAKRRRSSLGSQRSTSAEPFRPSGVGRAGSADADTGQSRLGQQAAEDASTPRGPRVKSAWELAPVPLGLADMERREPGFWQRKFLTLVPRVKFFSYLSDR